MSSLPKGFLRNPVHLLAFGFGSGCSPKAPGTAGTLMAVPLCLALSVLPATYYLMVVVLAFVAGIWICDRTAKTLGVHDHGGIVWDEFVGFWITMFLLPISWISVLLGFVLFRLFDIWKPWPIGWLDRKVSGGFGIMLDDVVAGIYAAILMQMAWYWGLF